MPSHSSSSRALIAGAFLLGLAAIVWIGVGFVGSASWLALGMTLAIAAVYLLAAQEIRRFRQDSSGLAVALGQIPQPLNHLADWLARVPAPLHNAVRQRIENGRGALPGLALTPYLIGLLVMLGMLGTFLGMVVTFKGAVFALEGSADLMAIRSALAAPIRGLGLSFGTSVAGVAGSAMLGLMSALARRERGLVLRLLEQHSAGALRPFTAAQRRDHSFEALQRQADALPQVVTQLQALIQQVEMRHQQLDERLSARQQQFHSEAAAAYTGLGRSVAQTLNESLTTSARLASDSIKPVVENAMAAIAQESTRLHERVSDAVQTQLAGISSQFAATTGRVTEGWQAALHTHERSSSQLVQGLGEALGQFNSSFESRASQLLAHVQQASAQQHVEKAQAEALQQAAWTGALQAMANNLQSEWQQQGAQTLAQQQAVCQTLEQTASAIQHSTAEQAARSLADVARLLEQSEALVAARTAAEADWAQQHGQRMDALAALWRSELAALRVEESSHLQTLRSEEAARGEAAVMRLAGLQTELAAHLDQQRADDAARQQASAQAAAALHSGIAAQLQALREQESSHLQALRSEEDQRGQAAVQRLGELQTAVTQHLATLGTSLEAPMNRLLETASEAPRAAAEVIAQLRNEMSRLTERDNVALQERSELVARISGLLQSVQQTTGEQRAAIESLVASATTVLNQTGAQFADTLGAQAGRADAQTAQMASSAAELAALGQAFQQGVALFSSTNENLIHNLQKVESAIGQSMARSDEQLAYYVAQAREVIDLSISAQQGIVEDLRRLRGPAKAAAGAV